MPYHFWNSFPELLNPDVSLELPRTKVPVRYIHATNDFAFVEKLAESNAEFGDGPYDHVLLDSPYWMLYRRPEEVDELIPGWLGAE